VRLVAIGGSDAGISAALRARELDATADVTVVLADAYPNFSICGIPYYVSGEVGDWHNLAHRTVADLRATGMALRLDTVARRIDPVAHRVEVAASDGSEAPIDYDALIIGTGAVPVRPPIAGLDGLGANDGVHLLHTMGDTLALMRTLQYRHARRAVIVGAGYVGLEMAEALTSCGLAVTHVEQLPEVLPTVDSELGALVRAELHRHDVKVLCSTRVDAIERTLPGSPHPLEVQATGPEERPLRLPADVVLVSVGVRPDSELAVAAGAELGVRGAIAVDRRMRTTLPDVLAAGDCVTSYHRLLGTTYLPLGTTAHKQGRIAGENALDGAREFAGILGTQVVKVFDLVAARTGLRDQEAVAAGFDPLTVGSEADDHKVYYPGSQTIGMRYTGDRGTGLLLGLQLVGRLGSEIAKRIDIAATAIFNQMTIDEMSDLDLSYTPPLGSPWDALQHGAQRWRRLADPCRPASRRTARSTADSGLRSPAGNHVGPLYTKGTSTIVPPETSASASSKARSASSDGSWRERYRPSASRQHTSQPPGEAGRSHVPTECRRVPTLCCHAVGTNVGICHVGTHAIGQT
jgi:NADPH-dependent 2,4-dienoyl-CoA reductase/sulfur reductase-like enzyme